MLLLQTRNQVTDSFRSKYVVIPIVDISLLNSLIRILHHDQQLMTHMNFLLSIIRTISVLTFLSKEKKDRCNNWDSLRIQIYRWKSMPTSEGWFCFISCDVGLPVKGSFPNEHRDQATTRILIAEQLPIETENLVDQPKDLFLLKEASKKEHSHYRPTIELSVSLSMT